MFGVYVSIVITVHRDTTQSQYPLLEAATELAQTVICVFAYHICAPQCREWFVFTPKHFRTPSTKSLQNGNLINGAILSAHALFRNTYRL